MKKYDKIKRLGHYENESLLDFVNDEIIIEEKIDGSNFRFWLEDGEIKFGSRNVSYLEKDNKQFKKCINYLLDRLSPNDLDEDLIYIGEFATPHTIQYDWENTPHFIGFDILVKTTGRPLDWKVTKRKFAQLNLEFVPVLWFGDTKHFEDLELDKLLEKSQYRDGKPEGVVIKNYNRVNEYERPLFAKVVNEHFEEKKKTFQPKNAGSKDTARVVAQYVTKARVRKIINKMVSEEGRELSRSLMGDLIHRVISDTLEEEILDITHNNKINKLDFGLLYKLAPKKCLHEIDKMMEEKVM